MRVERRSGQYLTFMTLNPGETFYFTKEGSGTVYMKTWYRNPEGRQYTSATNLETGEAKMMLDRLNDPVVRKPLKAVEDT